MKYLKYLFILLFIPFIVLAEECDISKITITSIEQNSIKGSTEVISEPTIKNRNINLDLKMYDVGDSITYDLVIKNYSEEDYMIDEDTFKTDSDYIEYTLETKDNTNVVKANSTKDVTLTVIYKNEVEETELTDNKFNATNSLKLSLNTNEKEKELDIITTDNINKLEDVKNPLTSNHNIILVIPIILITIAFIVFLIIRKSRYTKYILLILGMILVPTVYAICKTEIEVDSKIEIDNNEKLIERLISLSETNPTCLKKYNGNVTDEVGKTVSATKVYFDDCEETRNVIFGGFCWQIIRTTETDGTKMMYNGLPNNNQCLDTRSTTPGLGAITTTLTSDSNYLYGTSYSIDPVTKRFILYDTFTKEFNRETYLSLLNKYTCGTSENVCDRLYIIGGIHTVGNKDYAVTAQYTYDGGVPYNSIGRSPFNANQENISSIGYMYNKQSSAARYIIGDKNYKYADSFTYNEDTKTFTLSGNVVTVQDVTSSHDLDNTRYTCLNTTGECSILRYILSVYYSTWAVSEATVIEVTDTETTIDSMLNVDDINKYDSTIKVYTDNWYKNNLLDYTKKLENTIYCNNRETSYNGFLPDSTGGNYINFKHYDLTNSIECNQITDQFSVDNDKAKLTYPVGLITSEELKNLNFNLIKGGYYPYWTNTPGQFSGGQTYMYWVSTNDFLKANGTNRGYLVRPVISLKKNNIIASGTGTMSEPWIIE